MIRADYLWAALGHGRPGALPVAGRRLLPRRRLLRPGIRCQQCEELRGAGQLERRVPHPGLATGSSQLPFRKSTPETAAAVSRD